MTQEVVLGDFVYVIDSSIGTQAERDQMYNLLKSLSAIPQYIELKTGVTCSLPTNADGKYIIEVAVSSTPSELALFEANGDPIEDQGNPVIPPVASIVFEQDSNYHLSYGKIYMNLDGISTGQYQPDDPSLSPEDLSALSIFLNEDATIVGATNPNAHLIPEGNQLFGQHKSQWQAWDAEYSGALEDMGNIWLGKPVRGGETAGDITFSTVTHDAFPDIHEYLTAWANAMEAYVISLGVEGWSIDTSTWNPPSSVENVWLGRGETILEQRRRIKAKTMTLRKNLYQQQKAA